MITELDRALLATLKSRADRGPAQRDRKVMIFREVKSEKYFREPSRFELTTSPTFLKV